MITPEQRLHNIKTKVRLVSDRIWRSDGYGVCTGDLERALIVNELARLSGYATQPIPEVDRAFHPQPDQPPLWIDKVFGILEREK